MGAEMAEALAQVTLITNIVQIINFSTKVVHGLDKFTAKAGNVPGSFSHIRTEILSFNSRLQNVLEVINIGPVSDKIYTTLLPVRAGRQEQFAQLDAILVRDHINGNKIRENNSAKDITVFHQDTDIESTAESLRDFLKILSFHNAAVFSNLQPQLGVCNAMLVLTRWTTL
jgi:hypothetical protein